MHVPLLSSPPWWKLEVGSFLPVAIVWSYAGEREGLGLGKGRIFLLTSLRYKGRLEHLGEGEDKAQGKAG